MAKKRLLVIEDDVDVAEMLLIYFSGQGYEVFNALSGTEGIAMARAKAPNLVLLDVMLPDMDGFDVCRALRTTALTRHIPITFLTQRDRRADKVSGLELGADDYITKPFDIEELRLRVQGQLRRSSRETLHDPRSGLPTLPIIEDTYNNLQERTGWRHLEVRVEGFRAFRDVYGFMAADEVLTFIGQVFNETIAQYGTPDDFVGSTAEDRYIMFTFSPDITTLVQTLSQRFQAGARNFYNFTDTERGYLIINEAHDDEQFIPLMYLAAVIMAEHPKEPTHGVQSS